MSIGRPECAAQIARARFLTRDVRLVRVALGIFAVGKLLKRRPCSQRAASSSAHFLPVHSGHDLRGSGRASSPTWTGRRMCWRFADWRRIDRRYLNGRITVAEAYRDARGQDGAKQQERPGAPPHGHTLQPCTGQHSRGRYCTGVEKQSPGVKPSAVHGSVRKWRITLALKRRLANCSKCSNCSRGGADRTRLARSATSCSKSSNYTRDCPRPRKGSKSCGLLPPCFPRTCNLTSELV